jgi:hypothetical protein
LKENYFKNLKNGFKNLKNGIEDINPKNNFLLVLLVACSTPEVLWPMSGIGAPADLPPAIPLRQLAVHKLAPSLEQATDSERICFGISSISIPARCRASGNTEQGGAPNPSLPRISGRVVRIGKVLKVEVSIIPVS